MEVRLCTCYLLFNRKSQLSCLLYNTDLLFTFASENRPSPSNVFSRLGNESSSSPGSSRSSSPLSMSLSARLEAAKYESKYSSPTDKAKAGPVVDRKKATPTQTKVTVTGLGKMVISSTPAEVSPLFIIIDTRGSFVSSI